MCLLLYVHIPHKLRQYHAKETLKKKLQQLSCLFPPQYNATFQDYELNVSVSNSLPLLRPIPDDRPVPCLYVQYDSTKLPKVSIIIPFHNEAWSLLLRTINSIIFRSPDELIEEIILVDDCSTYSYLHKPLDMYISAIQKARIIRMERREGLIRTRLKGARVAVGKVLVFLDAHVECNEGWLEPLLHAVANNRTTIAVPHMDVIDPDTLQYGVWQPELHGGFTWTMEYIWKWLPSRIKDMRHDETDPIFTPTTIGCAFVVEKAYFFQIGAYDEGLYIWGGENLEISFKTWLCGGSMFIYPCSRVAHMFREKLPYVFPFLYNGTKTINKNYQRLVEVWLGGYKKFYYAAMHEQPYLTSGELATLNKRKTLKDTLKCKGFKWYMKHIIPEMFIPWENTTYQGQIKNTQSWLCLTVDHHSGVLSMSLCSQSTTNQYFYLTVNSDRLYHNYTHCLLTSPQGVHLSHCNYHTLHNSSFLTRWSFNTSVPHEYKESLHTRDQHKDMGRLILQVDNSTDLQLCLTQVTMHHDKQFGGLMKCDTKETFQYWVFTYKMNFTFHGY